MNLFTFLQLMWRRRFFNVSNNPMIKCCLILPPTIVITTFSDGEVCGGWLWEEYSLFSWVLSWLREICKKDAANLIVTWPSNFILQFGWLPLCFLLLIHKRWEKLKKTIPFVLKFPSDTKRSAQVDAIKHFVKFQHDIVSLLRWRRWDNWYAQRCWSSSSSPPFCLHFGTEPSLALTECKNGFKIHRWISLILLTT